MPPPHALESDVAIVVLRNAEHLIDDQEDEFAVLRSGYFLQPKLGHFVPFTISQAALEPRLSAPPHRTVLEFGHHAVAALSLGKLTQAQQRHQAYNTRMAQSKAESFTAYLEEKQRAERTKKSAFAVGGGTAFSILAVLAGSAGQPMSLPNLQAASGISFNSFAEAIKRLQDLDYITLTGAPGNESAQLTKLGADVASLVHST